MDKEQVIVLKVSGKTPPSNLKSAIVGYIKDGKTIYLDSIGVMANYVATKALVLSKGQLSMQAINLIMTPAFQELKIDEPIDKDVKTAIRWILIGAK